MEIWKQIEVWAKKGLFVEYNIIDQAENGYGEMVAAGDMPAITYTVYVNNRKTDEIEFDESCDSLEEGYSKAFAFLSNKEISV